MFRNINIKKMAVTIVAAILLIILYSFIFRFSEQDGEESSSLSFKITMMCTDFFNKIAGKHWTEEVMESIAAYFEHPIRKLAHFTEYAIMGSLISIILFNIRYKLKPQLFIATIWVFLSAAFDEIHQLFIPGRSGNFMDVLLDTSGGITGFFMMYLIYKLLKKWKIFQNEGLYYKETR